MIATTTRIFFLLCLGSYEIFLEYFCHFAKHDQRLSDLFICLFSLGLFSGCLHKDACHIAYEMGKLELISLHVLPKFNLMVCSLENLCAIFVCLLYVSLVALFVLEWF